MNRLINFLKRIFRKKTKEDKKYDEIMKELKKRDPFTYNH